jgi:hypothetical protein
MLIPWSRKSGETKRTFLVYVDAAWAQGCQMVYLHAKNTNLGIFWRALENKMLLNLTVIWVYFTTLWQVVWPFGIFYSLFIPPFWYVLPRKTRQRFGIFWYISPFWYVLPRKIWQPCLRIQLLIDRNADKPMHAYIHMCVNTPAHKSADMKRLFHLYM